MDLTHTTEHVPQGCFLCHGSHGPFIDTMLIDVPIQTADGEILTQGRVAICIGDDEHPGCAYGIARTAGFIDGAKYRDETSILRVELAEAKEMLAAAKASQFRVVGVDELLKELRD